MKRKVIALAILLSLLIGSLSFSKTGLASETGQKHLKVNNTILDFNEIIYVNGVNGDDANGDGSKEKPFKTVVKGFDYLNEKCREGGAIVISEGTYDIDGLFTGKEACLNKKYNKLNISLIAQDLGKVKFINTKKWIIYSWTSSGKYADDYLDLSFYGIIMNGTSEGTHLDGNVGVNKFFNCVFNVSYGGFNGFGNNANPIVQNCIFNAKPHGDYTNYPASGGSAINSASINQYMDPCKGTIQNALYNATFDENYNITSQGWKNTGIGTNPDGTVANIGVYGGQFSWGSKVVEIPNPPVDVEGNKAILEVVMTNGTIKEYDLTAEELNKFLTWYDNRSDGTGKSYFKMPKRSNVKPFISRNEYLSYDKIYSFEVKDYNE